MVVFVGTVTVHPDKGEEAEKVVENYVKVFAQQPGTLQYWVGHGQTDPTAFVFYEVYRDEDAIQEHRDAQEHRPVLLVPWRPLIKSYQYYAEVASIEPKPLE